MVRNSGINKKEKGKRGWIEKEVDEWGVPQAEKIVDENGSHEKSWEKEEDNG